MLRLRNLMTPASQVRYLVWRAMAWDRPIEVALADGAFIWLRPPPATDLDTAYEVFVAEVYRGTTARPAAEVRRIVDVGANVGFSVLYWARRYPAAHIVAFEPHPTHLACLRRCIARNGLGSRTTVHAAAACTATGDALLTDAENRSSVVRSAGAATLRVAALDFFEAVGPEPIDLLKIDVEGGEYPLLSDPRMSRLRPSVVVVEWHKTEDHDDGEDWCSRRLVELGYTVHRGLWSGAENGLLWGYLKS